MLVAGGLLWWCRMGGMVPPAGIGALSLLLLHLLPAAKPCSRQAGAVVLLLFARARRTAAVHHSRPHLQLPLAFHAAQSHFTPPARAALCSLARARQHLRGSMGASRRKAGAMLCKSSSPVQLALLALACWGVLAGAAQQQSAADLSLPANCAGILPSQLAQSCEPQRPIIGGAGPAAGLPASPPGDSLGAQPAPGASSSDGELAASPHRSGSGELEPMTQLIGRVVEVAAAQATATAAQLGGPTAGRFPQSVFPNGTWKMVTPGAWTSGFWPGVLWQLHGLTGDAAWSDAAMEWQDSLKGHQRDWQTQHDHGARPGSTCL